MVRLKKHIAEAINQELRDKDELTLLLKKISHKYISELKRTTKKSKDRGGNDGKKNPKKAELKTSNKKEDKEKIKSIISQHQIGIPHIKIPNQPNLSEEQKLIVNWDFEGVNLSHEDILLSTYFNNALITSENYDIENRHDIKEYDLNDIPTWSEMKKFKNFQNMHLSICRELSKMGYPPEDLKFLNTYDIAFLIKKHNKENSQNLMQCQRTKFLKMFAACYGEEFVHIETLLGRKEHAENFLEYVAQLNTNKNISEKRYEKLMEAASFYNVHHKRNRQFANEADDYSIVNDISNLTLTLASPYHNILHHPQEIDLNTNIVYFGGLRKEFQIIRDPEKERQYFKGNIRKLQKTR